MPGTFLGREDVEEAEGLAFDSAAKHLYDGFKDATKVAPPKPLMHVPSMDELIYGPGGQAGEPHELGRWWKSQQQKPASDDLGGQSDDSSDESALDLIPQDAVESETAAPSETDVQFIPAQPAAVASSPPEGLPPASTGAPRPAVTAPAGAPTSLPPIDTSGDPERFFATAAPYAKLVEQETGVPAALSLAIAANETGYGQPRYMAGAHNYHGIQAPWNDETGTPYVDWRPGPAGEEQSYPARQRAFKDPLDAFRGFARVILNTPGADGKPRYAAALERYRQTGNDVQLAEDIRAAGYAEDPQYGAKVGSLMRTVKASPGFNAATAPTVTNPRQSPTSAGDLTPNQIEMSVGEGLDMETALAVCGPAAAIAFARQEGRNPTMKEALTLAQQVGWTVEQGMAGPKSQVALLKRMGIAATLTQDWNEGMVAKDVQRGNPVIFSSAGGPSGSHYFVAERYDPDSGMFDFGNSARVLKASQGRRWFKLNEIERLGFGAPAVAIFHDAPDSPSPSVVAGRMS